MHSADVVVSSNTLWLEVLVVTLGYENTMQENYIQVLMNIKTFSRLPLKQKQCYTIK